MNITGIDSSSGTADLLGIEHSSDSSLATLDQQRQDIWAPTNIQQCQHQQTFDVQDFGPLIQLAIVLQQFEDGICKFFAVFRTPSALPHSACL